MHNVNPAVVGEAVADELDAIADRVGEASRTLSGSVWSPVLDEWARRLRAGARVQRVVRFVVAECEKWLIERAEAKT